MKALIGTVVSARMTHTVVVSVERQWMHRLYKKIIRKTRRYKAHCDIDGVGTGDTVRMVPSRPLSKDTHFRVVEKL